MSDANFSTGPVALSPRVRLALAMPVISHRSQRFIDMLREVRESLRRMTRARHVAVVCGSGTLANETIAQQLRGLSSRGLILVNGEFGGRLAMIAARAGLEFDTITVAWGQTIETIAVRTALHAREYGWLWCVATETSTGSRFDIDALQDIADECDVRLCIDCMSAIGTTPLDLSRTYLASASSGKGLASLAGLALVFANSVPPSRVDVPASLDLALHLRGEGVPFTMSSVPLCALHASLVEMVDSISSRYASIARDGEALRCQLASKGLNTIVNGQHAAAGVATIALPHDANSLNVGRCLREAGIEIGFESEYLRQRNWIQVALMGHYSRQALDTLPAQIHATIERATDAIKSIDRRAGERRA
jgi:aspartate aminotransferase-like enzyme